MKCAKKYHLNYNTDFNRDCPVCIKKRDRLIEATARLNKWNALHSEIQPYARKYQRALKEIWKQPIKCTNAFGSIRKYDVGAIAILKESGLIDDWRYNKKGWKWNWVLKDLNKRLK